MGDPVARIAAIVNRLEHAVDPLIGAFPKVTDQLRESINILSAIPDTEQDQP